MSAAAAYTAVVSASIGLVYNAATASAAAPPIRTNAQNSVPACVTPARLDAFLERQIRQRGHRLHPNHRKIAKWYRRHGETHRVRWDYAFFQMALETNFLSFRKGNGRRGDVRPSQNNFAGLGTTGGGVPGDRYPNVSTGVLAQIQHLVVYSGERLSAPVGHRTRLKHDVILRSIGKIARRRAVTFADLARRWAADRRYGRSIQRLAKLFYDGYCQNQSGAQSSRPPATRSQTAGSHQLPWLAQPAVPRPRPLRKRVAASSKPIIAAKPTRARAIAPRRTTANAASASCNVQIASYGGNHAVLIENTNGGTIKLTALNVQPGFEAMMARNFIQSYAPGGRTVGQYRSRSAAIAKARALCRQRKIRQKP